MKILGIETSCDETSASVVTGERRILSNIVLSQLADHEPFGGVVPEIASRRHVEELPGILREAMDRASTSWDELDCIAVTYGPGLASSLLIGLTSAKALSLSLDIPLVGVNHLEGHLCSLLMGERSPDPETICPVLVLLVSGGHTALVRMDQPGVYRQLGQTLDDAAGEALDKGASMMGLGYPGGPAIENEAGAGRPDAVSFPRGLGRRKGGPRQEEACAFSFSGVKTALMYYLKNRAEPLSSAERPDVAASYQEAVFDSLCQITERALDGPEGRDFRSLACVGGVARNQWLREKLSGLAEKREIPLFLAPFEYCTDNAAMIAHVVAVCKINICQTSEPLDVVPGLGIGSGLVQKKTLFRKKACYSED